MKNTQPYKFLYLLAMFYITIILAADVLVYKIVQINSIVLSVGSFIVPFWFVINDVITEVYGYPISRKIIWASLVCGFFFSTMCGFLIHLPSPNFWHYQADYNQVLGKLPRVYLGSLLGVFTGSFINSYLVSRWKILTKGKYFWLRSICASGCGQLIFTITTLTLDMFGVIPFTKLCEIILVSYAIKIITTPFLSLASTFFVFLLKESEGIDYFDYRTNFNPFSLESDHAK